MITIQTNYKPRSRERLQAGAVHKDGVYPDKANPKGFDFKSDQYDTHVEKGNANIGIEYGRGRAAPRAHPAHAGGLPNFYKDDCGRARDGYRKRETARQMHVDVKLLPQSNLKDLLQLYITKTVEALETAL
eukprot:tig00000388_g24769.t1